jgi:hypothetical protein
MKFLILFLILAISIQPLQAGVCDMDMEQGQEASHHMQAPDEGDHDCCDSEDSDGSDSQPNCGSLMHCGSCNASFSTLPDIYRFNASWVIQYSPALSSDALPPSHSTPLFRPPIA